MKATIENIKEIISETDGLTNVRDILVSKPLREQGIDSLDMANIYLNIEEFFNIKIADEDLDMVESIDDVIVYVNSKLV